jgi:hypothetical protein
MGATLPLPHNQPVPVGPTHPPPSTSHEHECRVPHPFDTCLKEGEGKEGVGSRKKGGEEKKGGGGRKVEATDRQEPDRHPPLPPPANDARQQKTGLRRR